MVHLVLQHRIKFLRGDGTYRDFHPNLFSSLANTEEHLLCHNCEQSSKFDLTAGVVA